MKQSFFFSEKQSVIVPKATGELDVRLLATMLKNIESLGYTFSTELQDAFLKLSAAEAIPLFEEILGIIKIEVGSHVQYKPMYANFPVEVMNAEESTLYLNNIRHYLALVFYAVTGEAAENNGLPRTNKQERLPLSLNYELKVIGLGDEAELYELLKQVCASRISISAHQRQAIDWAIQTYTAKEIYTYILPDEIPNKEILSFVVSSLYKYGKADIQHITSYFQTATDVLRFAVSLSGGDVSLASSCRFRNFSRAERRLLLQSLENKTNIIEDFLRRPRVWIRLGEKLHPGDYKNVFPNALRAFDIVRNNLPYQTFSSHLEAALLSGNVEEAITLLSKRPGEFARRLDHLLRICSGKEVQIKTLDAFAKVAEYLPTSLLLQVMAHFRKRPELVAERVFFPKGNEAIAYLRANELAEILSDICHSLVQLIEQTLINRFKQLPPIGRVAIDPLLREQFVPFSDRSASKSLHTLTRGSKLPLTVDGNVLRFFVYWKEGIVKGVHSEMIDVDLSAVFYDEDWIYKNHISYTNLRDSKYGAVHSGDVRMAPNGASEFIDVDIEKCVSQGVRYVVSSIQSFSRQPYCDMPECFTGWMIRNDGQSGEIYDPRSVVNKIDVSSSKVMCIPAIFDLVEHKMIWCDLAPSENQNYHIAVESQQNAMLAIGKGITQMVRPTLYDLFVLHAQARGEIVEDVKDADIIFGFEDFYSAALIVEEDGQDQQVNKKPAFLSPFDRAVIISEYLA